MYCVVLEVGESGLKVGFEGRGVWEVLEEIGAMVLEVAEGFLELGIELRGLFE